MIQASPYPLWTTFTLRRKLSTVSVAFILFLSGLILFNALALYKEAQYTQITDLAGRQRTLAQKATKEALLAGSGIAADPGVTLRLMRDSLSALMDGGDLVNSPDGLIRVTVPAAPSAEIRAHLGEELAVLRQFDQAVSAYLALAPTDPRRADRLKEMLAAQGLVSDTADAAVKLLSQHAAGVIQPLIWGEVVAGILVALIAVGISRLIGRQIAEPLEACSAVARRMADGDLRLEPLPTRSNDEVGVLLTAFNEMIHGRREVVAQLRAVCDALVVASASIQATAQEQAAGTKEQAAAVQEITTTVEEISLSGKQVAERSRQVAGTAEAVASSGITGLQAVRDASVGMESIREQTETVAENIITLSERTQAVGEIIATVNEIAEQSNLVALNAAIEAADAREQGRRFSVVAGEIKNLADQAKEATAQVRGILEQTQKGINTSVMLTEEALKRVEVGRERTTQSEHVIRQMSENIQESVHAFQQIVGATNQQQIGLEQVTQALHEIRQASQQTAVTTSQLERASMDLSELGQKLAHVLENYRL